MSAAGKKRPNVLIDISLLALLIGEDVSGVWLLKVVLKGRNVLDGERQKE